MHISLMVPAPFDTISGGYLYDRRMVECLRTLGHDVRVVELQGRFPDPDQAAIDAAHAAWAELDSGSVPLIDGLALPAFAALAPAMVPREAVALIHHPVSQETGLEPEVAQRLAALETCLFAAMPCLVTTSEQTADRLAADFKLPRTRVQAIVPGVEDLPRSIGSAGKGCAILAVGALIPRKGYDVLLRSLARLTDLDWQLTIVGAADRDKVHANGLAALVEKLGIARRVRFAGELPPERMDALWMSADLFALTSWYEGYGMALAEALRRGLPVAVTATGAAPTLVPPEAGVVCAPGDVEQLAKALRRLIFDGTLRRDFAATAWEAGRALPSWMDQAQRLAAVLHHEARLDEARTEGGK
jgi:glycosyltransferase involved in cell wall biosynthesis